MKVPRALKWLLCVLLAMVILPVIAVGAGWLYYTEPWYGHELVERLPDLPYLPNRVAHDDTALIAAFFPRGMLWTKAEAFLRKNGFSCSEQSAGSEQIKFTCVRKPHEFGIICDDPTYTIYFSVVGGAVADMQEQSWKNCTVVD